MSQINVSSAYEEEIIKLKNSGHILSELLPSTDDVGFDTNDVISMLEKSYPLTYNEETDVLEFIDENGDTHLCPDLSIGLSESGTWLSDKLPIPSFDFDMGGNVRKASEMKACYKLACLSVIFKEFSSEISETISMYNDKTFSLDENVCGYNSLTSYLNSFLELNSLRINCVVSAASIRISQVAEKKDAYWRTELLQDEILEYGRLQRSPCTLR